MSTTITRPAVPQPPAAPAPPVTAAEADTWLRRFRALLIGILGCVVAGIGALAFYTSFEAIKSYANGSQGIDPHHDFAIPLLVDSFIVVATGADLWFTTTGRNRRLWEIWWPKALLAGAAGVSFTLNVAHVQGHNWAARGVAAIPPAALILGVELLMQVLRRATMLRTERLQAAALPVPPGTAVEPGALAVTLERNPPPQRNTPALPARRNGGPPARRKPKSGTTGAEPPSRYAQAVAWVLAERAAGHTPTGSQVAARFQVSTGLGRRAIRDAGQAAEPAHQPQPTAEALRLVGDRSSAEPAPALPAAPGR